MTPLSYRFTVRPQSRTLLGKALLILGPGLAGSALLPRPCEGQKPPSRLLGRVVTQSETPLAEVEVTLLDLSRTVLSDSVGYFDFGPVAAGDYVVRVRRIGFRAQQFSARLEPSRTKDVFIVMEAGVYALPDVQVTARSLKPIEYAYTHKYDDFFRYRNVGLGSFKIREQFERLNPLRVADILLGMSRVRVRFRQFGDPEVDIPGCRRMAVWIDGSLQYPPHPSQKWDDRLERIHPSHVEMVAVFRGPAEMPAEAAMFVNNDCAIMIWTR